LTTFATTLTNLSLAAGGNTYFMADITIDPLTGLVYGYDANAERMVTIDLNTGVIDNQTFPANQSADIFGALYFDAFGELHGYGRPNTGNTQNSFYDIDKNTGLMTLVTTGPSANQNDGCSCPFTIEINHWVAPGAAEPCDTVQYYVEIANNSGGDKSGLDLELQLDSNLIIGQILSNPFTGAIQSGVGTSLLSIPNVTVPVGIDTMIFTVIVAPQIGGVLSSQAVLSGLPPALGDSVLSDDPFSPPEPDSASLSVTPSVNDLPNQTATYCQGEDVVISSSLLNSGLPISGYLWSDGSTNGSLTVNQPGTYWVRTFECATWVDTIVVSELSLPNVIAAPDTTVCLGESVPLLASGASAYQWWDLSTLQNIGGGLNLSVSPQDTNAYVVQGFDQNGCVNVYTIVINPRPLPIVDPGPSQTICIYDSLILGALNNVPGQYSWSPANQLNDPGLLQPTFNPNGPGTFNFQLSLTDTFGCVNSASVSVLVNDFALSLTSQDVDCFGNDNGSASLTVVGAAPFQYLWQDNLGLPQSSGTQNQSPIQANNFEPGQYRVILIDGNGCQDSLDFQITQPAAPLDISILTTQNVDCFGNLNGQIQSLANGGTAPYQYSIDGGINFQNNGNFGGLGATIYTILSTDANGCTTSIADTIASPTGLFGNLLSKRNLTCFGADDGQISLAGSGGTGPYSLTLDGQNFVNGLNLNNLAPGLDTVRLVDQNGCEVRIPFSIAEPPLLVASPFGQRDIDCFGNAIGELSVQTNGGSGDYLYSLDGQIFIADSFFTQLQAGSYQVIVQDDSLCQDTVDFLLTEPPLLELLNAQQKDIDCFGNQNGVLWLSPQGGTAPYQLALDTLPLGPDTVFAALAAGSYQVRVVDDSACEAILPITISQPDSLELSISRQVNVACHGDSTAFVHLTANGGVPAYQYSMNGQAPQVDSIFQNLLAGTYSLQVIDDSSCVTSITAEITEPAPLTLGITDLNQVDCFGNANGSVAFTVGGG
ncbi:MAG: SprB repeat-containing protein, partial [Bacteroidota bacterium]